MWTNYLLIAFRNLSKNKGYSIVTILGLALGLACVFLITSYVRTELSYDRYHEHASNIYRVIWATSNPQTRTPHPLAQAMAADFSEVESGVSITPLWGSGLTRETFSFRNLEKDIRYDESNVLAVDTTFFDVFTVPLIAGDPKTVLKNTGGLLISEAMAEKYFKGEDPLGKQLAVNDDRNLIEVIGIFKNFPQASHMHADFLVSYLREKSLEGAGSQYYTWNDFGHYNYIRLKSGTDAKELESRMMPWARKYIDVSDEEVRTLRERNYGFRLQHLTDIHLHSHIRWELEPNGYIAYIYILMAAAILILIIGSVNFINLTTAQSVERAKEIGVRKALGANRRQLALQFTAESVLVCLMSTFIAAIGIEMGASWFTLISGQEMQFNYSEFIFVLGGLGLLTGLAAGALPSLYLSNLKPGLILKGAFIPQQGRSIRSYFIIFQFFASMVLISASLIIYQQLDFIQSTELGFQQDQVISVPIRDRERITPRLNEISTELLNVSGIQAVSAASNIPGHAYNQNAVFSARDPQTRITASEAMVDYDFFEVMSIPLHLGRSFTILNPADSDAFVINETLARNLFGERDPVGLEIVWDSEGGLIKGTVIGVVKDFHFQSLHTGVDPLFFRLAPNYNYIVLKVQGEDFLTSLEGVKKVWTKFDTEFGFDYSFLRDDLNQQYSQEQNMAGILSTFSGIALIIACFGLLGIAALTFRQRTKEVSVRKVLGASRTNLMVQLLGSFTKMILIAALIAVPLVWWIMDGWLQNFAYRIAIQPLLFIIPGFLLLAFAWGTLGYLTWKVSNVNPAETLRSE